METNDKRECGACGQAVIPRGVDWPIWRDGKPICIKCNVMTMPVDVNAMPPCPACGAMVGITHFKTVSCIDCPYDAGGVNDTEDQAVRVHLLNCQRLSLLVPVAMLMVPDGWQLVPKEPVEAMWCGLARRIMVWLEFNDRHTPRSLLDHLNNSTGGIPDWIKEEPEMVNFDHSLSKGTRAVILYKAMLADAPMWTPPQPVEGQA